jgi:O-methyltransferase
LSGLNIENVSIEQLIAMGDGLLAAKQATLAKAMYGVALKRARAAERQKVRTRLGLAQHPNRRTPVNLEILQALDAEAFANPFISDGLATWLKILPFADDERFQDLSDKHAALLPIPNWHWNLNTALWAVQQVKNVPGDLVELGVFRGHTTLFCAEYVEFQSWPKTWWLYDTFDGIPDDQIAPGWDGANKDLYKGTFSYEEVAARFRAFQNIRVIQGRVPDVLAQGAPDVIAFMHIDMNNAPAEIGALDALFDRLSVGGIILFDDYCWDTARVQHKAEKAWFEDRGLKILGLPTGQGLFVKTAP